MTLPKPFPSIDVSKDYDPGIRLFGKRFFSDQTCLELVSELLSVAVSKKQIGKDEVFETPLPSMSQIREWSSRSDRLYYTPGIRLGVKLFAFLPCSRIDSRHQVHTQHYDEIVRRLEAQIASTDPKPREVIEWLGELMRGLQGAGFNRTWCAQTFWPLSPGLISQETIWNETTAVREPVESWAGIIGRLHTYFSVSKHRFLARGGELLYLQICNALATEPTKIAGLADALGTLTTEESNPDTLHGILQTGFSRLAALTDTSFERLIGLIESVDPDTVNAVADQTNPLGCEWCPVDSWAEGYLYAVETSRVLRASLAPMEQISLLMVGAALQVLRSLCSQSVRYVNDGFSPASNPLGYAWILTPQGSSNGNVMLSRYSLHAVLRLIYRALRNDELRVNASKAEPQKSSKSLYREADARYGHKLFVSLAKKIGLVAPVRGPNPRFVMTDLILRYLVLALLRPGERCTYSTFLNRLYLHYGIAIEGSQLDLAAQWAGLPRGVSMKSEHDSWLQSMLRAGGSLIDLSDKWAIVQNNFQIRQE